MGGGRGGQRRGERSFNKTKMGALRRSGKEIKRCDGNQNETDDEEKKNKKKIPPEIKEKKKKKINETETEKDPLSNGRNPKNVQTSLKPGAAAKGLHRWMVR